MLVELCGEGHRVIRKRVKSAAAIFVAAATLASVAGVAVPATAAPVPGPVSIQATYYRIRNYNDARCLKVDGYTWELPVIGVPCVSDDVWFFTEKGFSSGSYFWIRDADAGPNQDPCILMRSFGSAAYKGVYYPCGNFDDQYWYLDYQGYPGNLYKFRNKAHGRCMVLRSWQNQVEGSACGDFNDQLWEVVPLF